MDVSEVEDTPNQSSDAVLEQTVDSKDPPKTALQDDAEDLIGSKDSSLSNPTEILNSVASNHEDQGQLQVEDTNSNEPDISTMEGIVENKSFVVGDDKSKESMSPAAPTVGIDAVDGEIADKDDSCPQEGGDDGDGTMGDKADDTVAEEAAKPEDENLECKSDVKDKNSGDNDEERNLEKRFDPLKVNPNLESLVAIKLDKYHGIMKRGENFVNVLPRIVKASGTNHEIKFEGPAMAEPKWKADLYINNVFIATSSSHLARKAKVTCVKQGVNFLISLGLNLRFDDRITEEQIKIVKREDLASCTIRQHFTLFLEEKRQVKMIFQFVEANQAEKELFEVLCEKSFLSMGGTDDSSFMVAIKKNSAIHKMELLPDKDTVSPAPVLTHLTVTKEDLVANPSIKDLVQKFVDNRKLSKLTFSGNLEVSQKELIELLVDKHELKFEIKEDLEKIVLWKDPIKKDNPMHKKRVGNKAVHEQNAKKGLKKVDAVKRPHVSDGEPSAGTSIKRKATSNQQSNYQVTISVGRHTLKRGMPSRGGVSNRGASIRGRAIQCQFNPSALSTSGIRTVNSNTQYKNSSNQSQWKNNQHNISHGGLKGSLLSTYNQQSSQNNNGASGYVPFETFATSSPSLRQNSNPQYSQNKWDPPQAQQTWNSRGISNRRGGRGNWR